MSTSFVIYKSAASVGPRKDLFFGGLHSLPFAHKHTLCKEHNTIGKYSIRRKAEAGDSTNETKTEVDAADVYEPPSDEPTFVGKLFGSYLQLGVWVVTLSFAGYKGFQLAQTDPSSVGLLIAPPAGALFLIITFLFSRFGNKKKE